MSALRVTRCAVDVRVTEADFATGTTADDPGETSSMGVVFRVFDSSEAGGNTSVGITFDSPELALLAAQAILDQVENVTGVAQRQLQDKAEALRGLLGDLASAAGEIAEAVARLTKGDQ